MANVTEEFLGNTGLLQIQNGVALDSTLRVVTDQSNIASTLYLSINQVRIGTTANNTPLALFGSQNVNAIISTANISGSEKTFTFPNASMTFAGINISQTFTAAQIFNISNGTSGTSNISIPTIPYSGGGRNSNHPTLVLGSVTGNIWGLSGFGTYLGINAASGFTGNLIDLKLNDTTVLNITQTGAVTTTAAGAASTPALSLTGTWFTGGTTTTTKPQYLIEPTGTTSTNWSINGTGLGLNAPTGFTGNLLDLQKNGVNVFNVSSTGLINGFVQITTNVTNINNTMAALRVTASTYVDANGSTSYKWATSGVGWNKLQPSRTISGAITTNPTSQPSAIMQIDSTTQGFLPPRMTTTQRDNLGILSVTSAVGNGTRVVYTCPNHNFLPGETVTISGATPSGYNITGVIVDDSISGYSGTFTNNTFALANTTTGTSSGTILATVTKVAGLTIYNTTTNLLSTWNGTIWIER